MSNGTVYLLGAAKKGLLEEARRLSDEVLAGKNNLNFPDKVSYIYWFRLQFAL